MLLTNTTSTYILFWVQIFQIHSPIKIKSAFEIVYVGDTGVDDGDFRCKLGGWVGGATVDLVTKAIVTSRFSGNKNLQIVLFIQILFTGLLCSRIGTQSKLADNSNARYSIFV